ncbi:MAG: N-acetyl-gamma-glutamyl-phosphate reductase [Thermodesulfobacteriota bacterium]
MHKFNVSIIGASGYTGSELVRLLYQHPNININHATASKHAEKEISEVFPHFNKIIDLQLKNLDSSNIPEDTDFVFTALPHGTSGEVMSEIFKQNFKIIDLGADFRLNLQNYKQWYGNHPCPELLDNAVYGISELNKEKIADAKLIANPGCYPTSSILPLAPLLKHKIIHEDNIIIDSKSGVSGAGRSPSLDTHFSEVNEGFKAYKVGEHRHQPEIEQQLSDYTGYDVNVTFTPHLIPINRGILSTIYVNLKQNFSTSDMIELLSDFYKDSYFIRIYPEGKYPNTSYVRGSNFCDIGIRANPENKTAIIVSAIDNLVKGASGQAIQNMNIMLGLPETTGINNLPLYP